MVDNVSILLTLLFHPPQGEADRVIKRDSRFVPQKHQHFSNTPAVGMSRTLLMSRGFFYREACGPRS